MMTNSAHVTVTKPCIGVVPVCVNAVQMRIAFLHVNGACVMDSVV